MTDVRLTATNPEDSSVVPVACNAKGEVLLEEPIAPPEFDGNLDGDLTVSGTASFEGGDVNIDSSGRLLLGTSNELTTFFSSSTDKLAIGGGAAPQVIGCYSETRFGPRLDLVKSRSATVNGQTIVSTDDGLGEFYFGGSDGTAPIPAARIVCQVDGTTGSNDMPGRLMFFTTASGSSTPLERMRINSNGISIFAGDVVVNSRGKRYMLVEQGGLCHMVEQKTFSTLDSVDQALAAATEYPKLRDVFAELNVIEKALEEVMEKLRMTEPDGWPVWDGSDNSR